MFFLVFIVDVIFLVAMGSSSFAFCSPGSWPAGYDAHWRDPLAGLQLRTSTFHWLSAQLTAAAERLCGGRLVFLLEARPAL